jgi:hypothetical protein
MNRTVGSGCEHLDEETKVQPEMIRRDWGNVWTEWNIVPATVPFHNNAAHKQTATYLIFIAKCLLGYKNS